MPRLLLYRFCFRDPRTGRWVRARYRASLADIRARYAHWKLEPAPESRSAHAAGLAAFAARPGSATAGATACASVSATRRTGDVALASPAGLAAMEVALLACFLRRYVTYCARRRRFAAMNGAARLLRQLRVAR